MAKALDFNTLKKQTFTITLPDKKKTVLLLTIPDKKTFTRFSELKDTLANSENEDIVDELYSVVGEIMSHNKAGKKITGEYLSGLLDFEDLIIFVQGYREFISGITNSKN